MQHQHKTISPLKIVEQLLSNGGKTYTAKKGSFILRYMV
jgi:hypothetical protein